MGQNQMIRNTLSAAEVGIKQNLLETGMNANSER